MSTTREHIRTHYSAPAFSYEIMESRANNDHANMLARARVCLMWQVITGAAGREFAYNSRIKYMTFQRAAMRASVIIKCEYIYGIDKAIHLPTIIHRNRSIARIVLKQPIYAAQTPGKTQRKQH